MKFYLKIIFLFLFFYLFLILNFGISKKENTISYQQVSGSFHFDQNTIDNYLKSNGNWQFGKIEKILKLGDNNYNSKTINFDIDSLIEPNKDFNYVLKNGFKNFSSITFKNDELFEKFKKDFLNYFEYKRKENDNYFDLIPKEKFDTSKVVFKNLSYAWESSQDWGDTIIKVIFDEKSELSLS
jgi:hypothetical protein